MDDEGAGDGDNGSNSRVLASSIILPSVRSARAKRNLTIKEELKDTHNSRIKKPWAISSNDMKGNHITSASALCQFDFLFT